MTTITIREQPNNTRNEYQATVSFNKDEFPCTINNPGSNEQLSDLEWYFKKYPHAIDDEDQERAKSVAANIKKCGTQLFEQVFCDRALTRRYDQAKNTGIQYIDIIGSPAFHSLPWETLHDPEGLQPLSRSQCPHWKCVLIFVSFIARSGFPETPILLGFGNEVRFPFTPKFDIGEGIGIINEL